MSAPVQATPQGAPSLRVEAARLGISQPGQYVLWLEHELLRLRIEHQRLLGQAKALAERICPAG